MELSLYQYSLCISLPLMLFFGFHMLLGHTPEKKVFSNFLLSRRLMGIALLVLAANYSVHLFYGVRFKDVNATILMNLTTYCLTYWLFSSALMTLLNNRYITKMRFLRHIIMWLVYALLAHLLLFLPAGSGLLTGGMIALAAWLIIYGVWLSVRLLKTYTRATRMFKETHSDDIGAYIQWLSIFTYWAIIYGVGCGLLTFLPDKYVFLWILSSIPFYIYLYCSYQNYILFHERVENALTEDYAAAEGHAEGPVTGIPDEDSPTYHSHIVKYIEEWIANEGFRQPGITLSDLSQQLLTNRTYLSEYINKVYHMSFRDWITDLRIEYAKRQLQQRPEMTIQEISDASGFLSVSHFSRTFSAKEGCSPARWRDSLQKK